VGGVSTSDSDVKDIASDVGMVFQDPEGQLVTDSPESEIAFGLENMGIERMRMKKRVAEVLATLGLGPLRDRRLRELSGGEKQKVALASVLVMHPRVLVLDEPTSQLDPVSAEEFLATLKSLNDELGLAVLLAEHRVERCFHFADRVLLLGAGRVLFDGTPGELASWSLGKEWVPLPPITRLFATMNGSPPPLTVKEGRMRVNRMAGAKGPGLPIGAPREERAPQQASQKDAPLVEARNLWHVYGDGTEALKGVDLSIRDGEFVGIIGENGSGKTTLIKHFNGILKPSRGKVLVDGEDIRGREVADIAATCAILPQNPGNQLVSDTVEGEVLVTLEAQGVEEGSRAGMLSDVLALLDLERFRLRNPMDLSCGERERVALATVLVYEPRLLVLDEPTRGIDQETKDNLASYLSDYHRKGKSVVLVTHDLEFAASCCRRVLMLGGGSVLADGDKHSVLSDSLFFTTQYNKCFRDISGDIVTEAEAARLLKGLS
jgi:energy-coupling factor transport system ATP-binding protein